MPTQRSDAIGWSMLLRRRGIRGAPRGRSFPGASDGTGAPQRIPTIGRRSAVASRANRRGGPARLHCVAVSVTTSPLLDGLNAIQREAVLHTEGPVLIVAGAGTARPVRSRTGSPTWSATSSVRRPAILAITFTNKAAREMAERVEGLLGDGIARGMWILTFHSCAPRLLRREHQRLDLPSSFTIYDEGDTERLIADRAATSRSIRSASRPSRSPRRSARAKDHVLDADTFASGVRHFYDEIIAKVYRGYEERKHAAGALDFDDLIVETRAPVPRLSRRARTIRSGSATCWSTSTRTRTAPSTSWSTCWRRSYRNVCVVGDADQGVYSWRGATIQNLLDFEPDYPDAEIFLMEQNYRSTQQILADRERADRAQRRAQPEELWTDAARRRARRALPGRERARGGAVRRRGDRAPVQRGGLPQSRRRGLLPDQRA